MKKRTIILAMVLFVAVISTKAQETVTTTGGEASGSGGSANYTVGQVVYTTNTGTNGIVAQGVQQPFEISTETGIKEAEGINLSVSAYPNPTIDYLSVKVENYQTDNLQYQVFDLNGKLLQTVIASGTKQSIDMHNYKAGNYFVKVLDSKKEIKVFKIIKN